MSLGREAERGEEEEEEVEVVRTLRRRGSLTQALFVCAVSSLVCGSGSSEERKRRIYRVHKQRVLCT